MEQNLMNLKKSKNRLSLIKYFILLYKGIIPHFFLFILFLNFNIILG